MNDTAPRATSPAGRCHFVSWCQDGCPMGVPIGEVRAAVALARLQGDGSGPAWSPAEWERVWVRLTKRQQKVVYLHVIVGLTITDTADQLGIGRGSADGAFRRAIDNIRDAIPPPN